jgi:hypothetical protein
MGLRCKNDWKRLDTGTSVPARGGFEPVSHLKATEGAANTGHLSPSFPRKPDGLLRNSRKQLISVFPRVKMASVYEYTS